MLQPFKNLTSASWKPGEEIEIKLQDLTSLRSSPTTNPSSGSTLFRKECVKLNRLKTGVGSFNNNMFLWGLVKSPFCNYGPEIQTAEHFIYHCPIHKPQAGNVKLTAPDETTIQ